MDADVDVPLYHRRNLSTISCSCAHSSPRFLMNGDEEVGNAPCTFDTSEFPILGSVSGDVFLPL
jgi:hypothetical protein